MGVAIKNVAAGPMSSSSHGISSSGVSRQQDLRHDSGVEGVVGRQRISPVGGAPTGKQRGSASPQDNEGMGGGSSHFGERHTGETTGRVAHLTEENCVPLKPQLN